MKTPRKVPSNKTSRPAPPSAGELSQDVLGARAAHPFDETVFAGMTPARMAAMMRESAMEDGDATRFFAFAREVEVLDPHYRSVLAIRKLAITGLEPEVIPAGEDAASVTVADAVKELVANPAFVHLMTDCLDGLALGYSACEIDWDTSGNLWKPARYLHREQRFFKWDRATSNLMMLDEAGKTVPLEPYKFVVHIPKLMSGPPLLGALARSAAWSILFKNYTLKDWMRFLEVYGMPLRVGTYGQGATEEDKRKLLRAITNMASDAAAVVPAGMKIEVVQTQAGTASGGPVFGQMAGYLDKQISKLVLSQTMTTDDGASRAQAEVHDEVRDEIKRADSKQLAATIQRDLINPFVFLNFGVPPEQAPKFILPVPEPEDIEKWVKCVDVLMERGMPVSKRQVREKVLIDEPDDDDDTLVVTKAAPVPLPAPAKVEKASLEACPGCGQVHMANVQQADECDRLVDAAAADALQPMLDQIMAAAEGATDFDSFTLKLASLAGELDAGAAVKALGTLMSKGRGLGDVTDDPQA